MGSQRLMILGIDGASWDVLNIMIDRAVMPNLKKLISGGVSGTLASTVPPYTPIAWSTFATGMNPGKHGVFDFVTSDEHGKTLNTLYISSVCLRVNPCPIRSSV